MKLQIGSAEAFFELESGDAPVVRQSYNAGYRLIETGEVLCTVQLPVLLAEKAILARSKILIALTPSGQVEATLGNGAATALVDDLVARAVADTNLRMEEATTADLLALLHRLERSLDLVKEAIARLTAEA
ncbi:hypothetical protein [Bradyrhizobium embrapense]|uniref:hypothetical protein n=1 Tax=Bradyrhizobium embrapense TaxID=630921 RepID=UPI0012F4D472|nr:hypothetical protein [Bradyrhizobium embrapense]